MYVNKKYGNVGEQLACNYLKNCGLNIVETNYRCKTGEIDIICIEREIYVFVEVKFRSSLKFGRPKEAISSYKINNIRRTALSYLKQKGLLDKVSVRFDCVEIVGDLQQHEIEHIKNIF